MKYTVLTLAACVGLAACATDGGGYGGYGNGYIGYDGFYDDHYGPIYGGYWNNDVFYYRNFRGGDSVATMNTISAAIVATATMRCM